MDGQRDRHHLPGTELSILSLRTSQQPLPRPSSPQARRQLVRVTCPSWDSSSGLSIPGRGPEQRAGTKARLLDCKG